jgi:ketosteroid isomerase-like protein
MSSRDLLVTITFGLILGGCAQAPPATIPDKSAAAEKAINDAITTAMDDFNKKDFDKFVDEFYTDDAYWLMPNAPLLNGKAAMRDVMKGASNDPNFSFDSQTTKVVASKAGDFGYAQGTATQTWTDPKTKKVMMTKDKWVTVFRQQNDGSMRAVADMFNADGPPVVATK